MRYQILAICLSLFAGAFAQTPFPEKGIAFNDAILPRVDIIIQQTLLDELLKPENAENSEEFPAVFVWNDGENIDTLQDIGFRLRGNTSRYSAKKSFKVDFTKFDGPRFHDLNEMNLNGEHNDPSIMRAKLCWDIYKLAGIPSTRASHVQLYINGEYRGLYLNVEHIDKRYLKKRYDDDDGNLYKCFFGADLAYRGNDPEAYKFELYDRQVYDLKTNKDLDDYSDLARFIIALNDRDNPDYRCQLEEVFNVDGYLRAMAMDILVGHWDGPLYNKNNFYLYSDPKTGQFQFIPYDLDNTFGIDWFNIDWASRYVYAWGPEEDRPLYDNLIAIPEYRQKLSYYLYQFTNDFFNEDYLNDYLDQFKDRLTAAVVNDTYAQLDYGFKLDDFLESFENDWGNHVKYGIKPYLKTRSESANGQAQTSSIAPILSDSKIEWTDSELNFSVRVRDLDLETVSVNYNFEGNGWQNGIELRDDGQAPDEVANDEYFTTSIPFPGFGQLTYYFEGLDQNSQLSRFPFCEDLNSGIGYLATPNLVINEFVASNTIFADEEGEFEDWLEIYNADSEAINLAGLFLSDDHDNRSKWPLPDITLGAGEFLLFWCDEDQEQGPLHTNFKLSKSGEELGLWDSAANNFAPIDTFTFGPMFPNVSLGRLPDGQGPVTSIGGPTPGFSNVPVGLQELIGLDFQIYPNPAQEKLQIDFDQTIDQMIIRDATGTLRTRHAALEPHSDVDISTLPAGIYWISIQLGDQWGTTRLVKL